MTLRGKNGHQESNIGRIPIIIAVSILLFGFMTWGLCSIITPHWKRYQSKIIIIPEYERKLETVALSLAHHDNTLEKHDALLSRFPPYTETFMLVPEENIQTIKKELSRKEYNKRVKLYPYDSKPLNHSSVFMVFPDKSNLQKINTTESKKTYHCGTIWAQDLFEPSINSLGQSVLLAAEIHKYYYTDKPTSSHNENLTVYRDNEFLEKLEAPQMKIKGLPLVFKGGNLIVDQKDERRIVFCGSAIINTTRAALNALDSEAESDTQIRKAIIKHFAADELVMLGIHGKQPDYIYHLDQAMIILSDGLVGVERVIDTEDTASLNKGDISKDLKYLSLIRSRLSQLGYKVFDIQVTANNIRNIQHYANAIPYIDKDTNAKTIMMPVYKSADSEIDRKLIKKNADMFRKHGYKVVFVPTSLDKLHGGIHCLANVLR